MHTQRVTAVSEGIFFSPKRWNIFVVIGLAVMLLNQHASAEDRRGGASAAMGAGLAGGQNSTQQVVGNLWPNIEEQRGELDDAKMALRDADARLEKAKIRENSDLEEERNVAAQDRARAEEDISAANRRITNAENLLNGDPVAQMSDPSSLEALGLYGQLEGQMQQAVGSFQNATRNMAAEAAVAQPAGGSDAVAQPAGGSDAVAQPAGGNNGVFQADNPLNLPRDRAALEGSGDSGVFQRDNPLNLPRDRAALEGGADVSGDTRSGSTIDSAGGRDPSLNGRVGTPTSPTPGHYQSAEAANAELLRDGSVRVADSSDLFNRTGRNQWTNSLGQRLTANPDNSFDISRVASEPAGTVSTSGENISGRVGSNGNYLLTDRNQAGILQGPNGRGGISNYNFSGTDNRGNYVYTTPGGLRATVNPTTGVATFPQSYASQVVNTQTGRTLAGGSAGGFLRRIIWPIGRVQMRRSR